MSWAPWDRAVRIAGLRQMLHMVTAVRDLPDDDPHVAALVDVLGVIAETRDATAPKSPADEIAAPIEPDETAIIFFERHVREGLNRLQAEPVPRPVQWAADHYFAAKTNRQARTHQRRPVPPSLDGHVAEIRQQLRRRR